MKSLGVCYWCAKIPHCGYMEHGLKDIAFMFKTYSSSSSLVITSCWFATSRLRVPASLRRVYSPAPYPTIHHSEQKCAHFCSEWCIVGYGTGALWALCDCLFSSTRVNIPLPTSPSILLAHTPQRKSSCSTVCGGQGSSDTLPHSWHSSPNGHQLALAAVPGIQQCGHATSTSIIPKKCQA